MTILKLLIPGIGLLIFIQVCFAQEIPQINSSKITFINGKELSFETKTVLHGDPEKALKLNEPSWIERSAQIQKSWSRVMLVEVEHYYESVRIIPIVYDYLGNLIHRHKALLGPVYFAPKKHNIFACEVDMHFRTDYAYIIDEKGKEIAKLEHKLEPINCEQTKDGQLVILQYSKYSNIDELQTVIKAFNFDGKIIFTGKSYKKELVGFEYRNRKYQVQTYKPRIPL